MLLHWSEIGCDRNWALYFSCWFVVGGFFHEIKFSVGWRKESTKQDSDSHRQMHWGKNASLILNLLLEEFNPEKGEGVYVHVWDFAWTCIAQRWAFMFTDTFVKHAVSSVWLCLIVVAQSLMITNFTPFAIFFLDKFSSTTAVQLLVRFSDVNIYMRTCFGQHLMSRRLWHLCYIFPSHPCGILSDRFWP